MNVIICSTVYQVIVATQLANTVLIESGNYLILTDKIKHSSELCKKIREERIFVGCEVLNCPEGKTHNWRLRFPLIFKDKKNIENSISAFLKSHYSDIQTVLFGNVGGFSTTLALFFKIKAPHSSLEMFEDGSISYSKFYEKMMMKEIEPGNFKQKMMCTFRFTIFNYVKSFYVFAPTLMVWNCPITLKTIPAISKEDKEIKDVLNRIFDYSNISDSYEEKVIFFEESYVGDGIEVGDVGVVEKLESKFGKNELFIKTHPRIADKRFERLGYKTNKDFVIPWEVIALNLDDLDDKILVTMTSTALISTVLLFDSKAKIVFNIDDIKQLDNDRVGYTIEVIEKLAELYPQKVLMSIDCI